MSPAAAKLLMCVCAGGTGVAVVPTATAIKHRLSPRHAVFHPASPVQSAALGQPLPCAPTLAAAPIGVPQLGLGGLSSGVPMLEAPAAAAASGFAVNGAALPISADRSTGEALALATGGGTTGGGGTPISGGGGSGGGSGGGGSGGGGVLPIPSGAPEPTSWALMITGFGLLGGAMRYRRPRQI